MKEANSMRFKSYACNHSKKTFMQSMAILSYAKPDESRSFFLSFGYYSSRIV